MHPFGQGASGRALATAMGRCILVGRRIAADPWKCPCLQLRQSGPAARWPARLRPGRSAWPAHPAPTRQLPVPDPDSDRRATADAWPRSFVCPSVRPSVSNVVHHPPSWRGRSCSSAVCTPLVGIMPRPPVFELECGAHPRLAQRVHTVHRYMYMGWDPLSMH